MAEPILIKHWHNGALGMCEHSNVNFYHQGVLSASQRDGGTTYGVIALSVCEV